MAGYVRAGHRCLGSELHPSTGLEMAGGQEGSAVCGAGWAFHLERTGLGRTKQLLGLESVTGIRDKMVQSPLNRWGPRTKNSVHRWH